MLDQKSTRVASIPKQVALFAHRHPFLEQIRGSFTKSERRQFERDVYDYAEALGLDHAAAKKQVIKARGFCGEEDYDSDDSALYDEIDDSGDILRRLGATSGPAPDAVVPSIEDEQFMQAEAPKTKSSPKKSPYFAASKTAVPGKKKRADKSSQQCFEESSESLKEGKKEKSKKRKRQSREPDEQQETDPVGNSDALPKTDGSPIFQADASHSQKASKRARKSQEQSQGQVEQDTPTDSDQIDRADALEPRTEAEAHENYLKSTRKGKHAHGQQLDQTEEDRAAHAEREEILIKNLRGDIHYEVEKELDLYTSGGMPNENQHVKDDLEAMKKEREELEDLPRRSHKSKEKKRRSDSTHGEKKSKSKKRRQTEEDFRRPMIQ